MVERFSHYIYFDHSATTPVMGEVAKTVYDAMTLYFGNASEPHALGIEAKNNLESARKTIADSIKASPDEILFTSGGTESNNTAIFGAAECYYKKGFHIITSEIEHPAVLLPLKILEQEGFDITYVPVDSNGTVDLEELKKAINPQTILISIMHANNIMGAVQPVEEIGRISREKGIVYHCDAVQSYTSIEIDVNKINADMLSISGHKIYGPKGIGALYIRKGTKVMPQIFGGGQERGMRSGTENIPAIMGMAKSVQILLPSLNERAAKISALRDYIRDRVLNSIPDTIYNGHQTKRLPGNCSFTFKNIEGSAIVAALNKYGIAVSAGSACKSASGSQNNTLPLMGICPEVARGSVRVSLGFENTFEEADYFIEVLREIVGSIKGT